jgi:hypothetical protein
VNFRKIRAGLAIAAAATLTGLAVQPAAAAAPQAECSLGYVCAFARSGLISEDVPVKSGSCRYFPGRPYTKLDNNTNQYQRMWTHENCTGYNHLVKPYGIFEPGDTVYYSIGGY